MRTAIAWVLAVGVLGAWPSMAAAQKPRADLPTYELGDQWLRTDGVFELTRLEANRYVFTAAGGKEVHLGRDLAPVKTVRSPNFVEMDPPVRLAWPLEVGKWGVQTGTWRHHGRPGGVPSRLSWQVKAYEDVTVGGKTYKAFRIELEAQTFSGASSGPTWLRTQTLWYAPEVRQYVRSEGPRDMMPLVNWSVFDVPAAAEAPVVLELGAPAVGAQLDDLQTTVAARVRARTGVTSITISVNGTDVVSQTPRTREHAVSERVPLKDGRNVILVTAVDATGHRQQEARVVFAQARPTAVSPPAAPPSPAVPPGPLVVRLTAPRDGARVEHESVALAGQASAGRGVSRVVVALNGVEVHRQEEKAAPRAVALNLPLRLREGANTLVVSVTAADGALEQEIRSITYERPIPFTIGFRYPEDRSRVSEESSLVAAIVESSRGVREARIVLNGQEVHRQTERAPQRSLLVSAPVTLREGANAVVVAATDADGTVKQEIRTVVFDRPKVVAAPAPVLPAPKPATERWAVVIGVGGYDSAAIPRLRYSVADAEAMYQTLVQDAGFKEDHVLLLTDRTERKPTLRNIKWALGTFLGRSARKDDTVLIFFAGHGAPEVDTRGIERDGLAKYLIPSDADPDDLYATALPMDELQTIFGRIESERVVAFLDACYSGAAGGRTFTARSTRSGNLDDLFLERLTRSKGRAIVTASRPTEVSIELPELGHGIFSYYLVQGLRGGADANRDGIVSLQELYEFVEQQVSRQSRSAGGNQHPVMKGELEGMLPLTKVRK